MDSWTVAKGILEAIAVLVGLFVAVAAVMKAVKVFGILPRY